MKTLAEALPDEINRVRKIIDMYKSMRGTPGLNVEPAIALMEASVSGAIKAAASGDVIHMLGVLRDLQGFDA